MVSVVSLLGGGLSGELNSFSVGLMAAGLGFVEVGFGVAELSGVRVDGVEATDLRTWAANSARVAGMGRPGPQAR